MTKFEYTVEPPYDPTAQGPTGGARFENRLNAFGQDGWQLVGRDENGWLILMRELREPEPELPSEFDILAGEAEALIAGAPYSDVPKKRAALEVMRELGASATKPEAPDGWPERVAELRNRVGLAVFGLNINALDIE